MFPILFILSILGVRSIDNYCINFYADSNAFYQKEDGAGGWDVEKTYHFSEKYNGEKMFIINGRMFQHDPEKHNFGIDIENQCVCKVKMDLNDLEQHIDFIQSKYPFGNNNSIDLPNLIILFIEDGKPSMFYEVNWQYYNE